MNQQTSPRTLSKWVWGYDLVRGKAQEDNLLWFVNQWAPEFEELWLDSLDFLLDTRSRVVAVRQSGYVLCSPDCKGQTFFYFYAEKA